MLNGKNIPQSKFSKNLKSLWLQRNNWIMPTVKLDINTGLEYSPTDEIDSSVKLHNFTVGSDGSLYKLPMLKNLKNTLSKEIEIEEQNKKLI